MNTAEFEKTTRMTGKVSKRRCGTAPAPHLGKNKKDKIKILDTGPDLAHTERKKRKSQGIISSSRGPTKKAGGRRQTPPSAGEKHTPDREKTRTNGEKCLLQGRGILAAVGKKNTLGERPERAYLRNKTTRERGGKVRSYSGLKGLKKKR